MAALLLAHRQLLTQHNIQPPDDPASELALNQFARLRNALEHVLIWFDANGGVPDELRPYFTGTILT